MSERDARDAEIATLLRREIEKIKQQKEKCGWQPHTSAWHRCFGEIAGLYRALQFIDPTLMPADSEGSPHVHPAALTSQELK